MTAWSEIQHPKDVHHPAESVLRCVCHAIETNRQNNLHSLQICLGRLSICRE